MTTCCERNAESLPAGSCKQGRICPERLGGGNYWPREQQQVMPAVEEVEAWAMYAAVIVAVALFVLVFAVMLT